MAGSESKTDIVRFLWFIFAHVIVILVCFILWYWIWLKRIGVEIPIDKSEARDGNKSLGLFHTTKELGKFWKLFTYAWCNSDENYWIKNCGLDAYLYIEFQRKIIKLLLIVVPISLVLSIIFNLQADPSFQLEDPRWRNDWTVKVLYGNKDVVKGAWSWVQIWIWIFITFITLKTVYGLKAMGRILYKKHIRTRDIKHDYEWLKSRTIHVRGLLKNDVDGRILESVLNEQLEHYESKVLGIIVVPDYNKLTELEEKRKDLEDLSQLLGVQEPTWMRIWVRKKYRTEEYYQQELEKIEQKMQELIKNPIKSSGHAYVVFDSYFSMSKCLQKFRDTPWQTMKLMWNSWWYKISKKEMRDDPRENFVKFEDDEEQQSNNEYELRKITLLMSIAKNPVDIIWGNMGGTRGIYFVRRYLWNILGIFLIIFISTPVVIFKTLQSISEKHLDLQFINSIPYIEYVSSQLPTLIILWINMTLILLIDQSAVSEKHSAHSTFQSAIFNKAVIYLHLNMVFIPFLSLQGQPIFNILKTQDVHTDFIREFTMINSSSFFVNLMIQYGVFTGIFYFLRLGELLLTYLSPWLVDYRRKYMNDSQPWRRNPEYVFQYGYFYCQMVTILTIGMLYSSISPLVPFAWILFFIIRNIVDSYLLLTIHRKEVESKLALFNKVLWCCLISLLSYQIFMLVYFYLNNLSYQTTVVGLMVVFTLIVIIFNIEQLFDPLSMVKIDLEEEEYAGLSSKVKESDFDKKDFERWRREYMHPLLIGSASNNLAIFNTEVKRLEDAKELIRDFQQEWDQRRESTTNLKIE